MGCLRFGSVRVGLLSFLAFTLVALSARPTSIAQQVTMPAQPSSRHAGTDQIMLTVTVMDQYGRYVANLSKDAFAVLDGKSPRDITFFTRDAPASIGILIDRSASMSSKYGKSGLTNRVREGVSRFIRSSNRSNDYFLMVVNKTPLLLLDTTSDSNAILAALDELAKVKPEQGTALYDTCYQAIEKLTRGAPAKRVIILISDGQENTSRHTLSDLNRLVRESGVLFYVIGIVSREPYFPLEYLTALDSSSLGSGGTRFLTYSEDQLYATLERIALELRHQYSIGFRPATSTGDGKWHPIKVEVRLPPDNAGKVPRLLVRNRAGYYSIKQRRADFTK